MLSTTIPSEWSRHLVRGAYDLHVHVEPDVMGRRITDLQLARRCWDVGLAGFGDVDYSIVFPQGAEFLLVVGDSGRQRRHVPMHVRVRLLAAEGQRIDALGRHRCRDGSRDRRSTRSGPRVPRRTWRRRKRFRCDRRSGGRTVSGPSARGRSLLTR